MTPDDLKASFLSSYTPSPKVLDLFEVWDIKHWLKESIEDIHTHTRPHHFKFELVDGKTEVKYKYWSDDSKWLPSKETEGEGECESGEESATEGEDEEEDGPLYILKDSYTVSASVPVVPPDLDSLHLDQLLVDLSRLPQDYISAEKKSVWEEFVGKLQSTQVQGLVTKQLPRLCVTRRTVPSAPRPSSSSALSLPPSVQTLVDKDNERPPVRILLHNYSVYLLFLSLDIHRKKGLQTPCQNKYQITCMQIALTMLSR